MKPIQVEDPGLKRWLEAYDTDDIERFLPLAFPPTWSGIRARILESGATMQRETGPWAPRWTPIGLTERVGRCDDESRMRSIIFRVHDCLHQLWGLPHPGDLGDPHERAYYKKAQMCGEVVVLTLCEFVYVKWLHDRFPELRTWIDGRCAVPMLQTVLLGRSTTQIALRLDEILHKQWVARWAREHEPTLAFLRYYTPMLEKDRQMVDRCLQAMIDDPEALAHTLEHAPRARFSNRLSGLELTVWMIEDFEHLLHSAEHADQGLVRWNRERRARIQLPRGWPC